jgi:L-lactate dehydrogenase complex protein LldF
MLTEECGFRPYMASVGIEVIETDLGKRIQGCAQAEDRCRRGVRQDAIGTDPANSDVH